MSQPQSSQNTPVTQWVRDLQNPDKFRAATDNLWNHYWTRLEELIRPKIGQSLQGKISEESVALDALDDFVRKQARGDFELPNRDAVWALLGDIACNKAVSRIRKATAAKRSPKKRPVLPTSPAKPSDETPSTGEPSRDDHGRLVAGEPLEAGKHVRRGMKSRVKRGVRTEYPAKGEVENDSFFEREPLELLLLEIKPEARVAFLELFRQLQPDEQQVVILSAEGLTDRQIADTMGQEPRAIRREREILWEKLRPLVE